MSDPNDLKPPETDSSSRSTSPKPVGMSIKERMAMFNKQAESSKAPAAKEPPPTIGRKPVNWQPTAERKVSSGEGKSGLSANDAASSISRPGGSLKDRMAALQGAFGSASAPSPAPKPEDKPKAMKQPDDVKSPIEESLQQDPSELAKSPSTADAPEVAQGTVPDVDKEQTEETAASGEEEVDEAEKERVKRQEIAARMARLGGMRLGGPPMPPPTVKKPESESEPETLAASAEEVQATLEDSDELQEEQKQEPEQDIPAPVDTTIVQKESPLEVASEVEPEETQLSAQAEPLPDLEQAPKDVKEPIEELNDQPMSMKAPPLARRAKPPRRRTPQTQVQTSDLDTTSTTPLRETLTTEQPLQGEKKEDEEEVSQEALSHEPDQVLTPVDDDEHPGGEHLHRFSPPKSPEEAPTSEQSTEDRRISIATALVDKPTTLNTAIEHFHSPLDKEETPVETPRDEIEPSSPLPIAQPSFPVTDVAKDEEAPSKQSEESVAPQNVATLDDDIDSSEPSDNYEPIDKKGKGRSTSFTSTFLGTANKPLATPGVEAENADVPQHIEDSFEHRLEEESKKAAEKKEKEAAAMGNDDFLQDEEDEPPLPSGKPIVAEQKQVSDENVQEHVTFTDESSPEGAREITSSEPVAPSIKEEVQAPVEETASLNAKDSITERMAKISMAGGFKFGPAPPVLNKPVQHTEEEEKEEEEEADGAAPEKKLGDENMIISEKPVEQAGETKEDTARPDQPETEDTQEPEETDAERRARIATKLAASGALRPVFGGAPEHASTAPQPPSQEDMKGVFDEEVSNAERSDDDDAERFMEGEQKESAKVEGTSDPGDSTEQGYGIKEKESQSQPTPSSQEEERSSIPMPSRNLPAVTTELSKSSEAIMHPEAEDIVEKIQSETAPEPEPEPELPPPIPSRQNIASPPAPIRSVPGIPQSPPKRSMPAAPPINTDFERGESKSVETSPSLASPPARSLPVLPSANSASPQRPPIPRKRPSVSSQHSVNRSSIGSILDQAAPPVPRPPSISSPVDQSNKRSSFMSSRDVPSFIESPQVAEQEENDGVNQEDNVAERRKNITERLAASGGIRPLVGGMPQSPSQPTPQPAVEASEPTEELSERVKDDVGEEETTESDAERRARIAKKLAMQGTIRPIFGGMETQEPAQPESKSTVEDSEPPKLTVENQLLETPKSEDLPPPVPRQRPRSFLARPASMISPPKSPPPTSPPPNPPMAPPSRQLPKLEPPTSPQQSAWYGEDDTDDEKHKSSGEFVRVPSRNLSVTTPKTERESFEFVASPKERDIPPSPRSPGKSPTGPRPAGKHIYTHDELVQLSQSLGRKISEFTKAQYELSKNMPIADGTSVGFVTETLAFCNAVGDPENWNFGHLIHSQNTQGIVKRLDDPRAGDILVLKHSEFKGRKAFGNYKANFGANGPQVAFVTEYDLKKGKVSAMQTSSQPNHYPTLEHISIKFGDLKDGSFDIFRPVPLS